MLRNQFTSHTPWIISSYAYVVYVARERAISPVVARKLASQPSLIAVYKLADLNEIVALSCTNTALPMPSARSSGILQQTTQFTPEKRFAR